MARLHVRDIPPRSLLTNVYFWAILLTRIVAGLQVFEAQRTDRRYLGDVLAGLCPVEVGGIRRAER